jgi:hypothetical protein
LTKAERKARKAFRQVEAERAIAEHETAQKAFHANRERLKAERLAREACRDARRGQESQDQEDIPLKDNPLHGEISARTPLVGCP